MTTLTTLPDADSLARRAAGDIARSLNASLASRGTAHLALSGGTTPSHTYELLARESVPWQRVDVWFADERCVGPDDPDSNFRLAHETLIGPAGIPGERVHRMLGELGPAEGARRYALELDALPTHEGVPVLDLVVLGIGPDGHVASLFPGASTLRGEHPAAIGVRDSPKPPPERITLSMQTLQGARVCLLLAAGAGKAEAIRGMLGAASADVPASLLRRERLIVLTDDDASPTAAAQ